MILIVLKIQIRRDRRDVWLERIGKYTAAVREEPGCLSFDVYESVDSPNEFSIVEGFASQRTTVVARYPNTNVIASGWLKGEELMSGRAAVVSVEMNPGRVVLFGLRPQHRAQTHATFPLLFNALYLSAQDGVTATKASN